jgi:Protein of unknown function (DUF3040)
MTLSLREERLLRRTDRTLSESDPDLASMLWIFARITAAERLPAWEQLRPRLAWVWDALLWPAAALAFVIVLVAGGGSRAAIGCCAAVRGCAWPGSLNPFRGGYAGARLTRATRPGPGTSGTPGRPGAPHPKGWAGWV